MKELFTKTSTTSIVALLMLVLCMSILFYVAATDNPKDATTRTQIVQGVFGLLMMVGGYYFGAAKNRPAQANTDSGDINVNPPVL